MPEVGIILGSDSDIPRISDCFAILEEFGVEFEAVVSRRTERPRRPRHG
jgi:phosphoribosylcarboxyaminoimidazole (NCAIR) mutase